MSDYRNRLLLVNYTFISSGVVTALLGIPVSQVVLGHSHTCVLTQLGTVYTFGGNNYGQCGRDYQPQEEEKKQSMFTLALCINIQIKIYNFYSEHKFSARNNS